MKTAIAALTALFSLIPISHAEQVDSHVSPTGKTGEVKLALTKPFRIFLTEEVLLTHHTGKSSSVSHWTKQIFSRGNFERKYADRFDARVLSNGFLEVSNGDDILLIPMEKVIAIRVTREEAIEAEQAGAGQPATGPVSKSQGGGKPQPESEGRSR